MAGMKAKTGVIIAGYSAALSVALVSLMFIFFSIRIQPTAHKAQDVVFLTDAYSLQSAVSEGAVVFPVDTAISMSAVDDYYRMKFIRFVPVISAAFCLIIAFASYFLWAALKRREGRNAEQMAMHLDALHHGRVKESEPDLSEALTNIKEKFETHVDDYRRLNSYISHEQKNALALLRAKLEMSGNRVFLPDIDSLSKNIDDILTISTTDGANVLSPVDVSLVCARVCDEYGKIIPGLSFDFDEAASNTVLAKEIWIYRAVCTLVDNAVKYGEGSPIRVAVRSSRKSVIMTVKDGGIGIDDDLHEKILNNRYRIDPLKNDGYGIGLSLVRHVCDLCHGFLWVESRKGQGSTFYLVLPEA